ncbi:oxidoreductase [Mycolicibacterium chitae]|uniref:Flavodoxin reductase family protein n=1 Tax=Mycolicibacterium chitae TaxID=1792 RepID=A0A448IA19_MYCCI|nr:ferredoxin reductase [Mycolicibacterium chitae]MCV7105036.1 ferredoxin reductase [Mycolicibacterium chitae]BBZ05684.1 oxidoreductase [Mycolicibacterium chitae]VEG49295.1 flavodoxin reductase family protein [Mycolicibacterium chitae]
MFTETRKPRLRDKLLRSPLMSVLTGPHGVDSYTELVDPAWTNREARATVLAVRRQTSRSVTLTLEPNRLGERMFAGFRAGQHINLTVEIDGRRHTRCYSPANGENAGLIELTMGRHEGGLVSSYLYDHARAGLVVGLGAPAGDFTLDPAAQRVLLVSGGSGITPVLSMLRTLRARGTATDIAFVHYARGPEDVSYARELAAMGDVRVLLGYTRVEGGDLVGRLDAGHLDAAMADPDAVYVCGPQGLVDAVRAHHPSARSESFVPPVFAVPAEASGGRVSFTDSAVSVDDDGRPLLQQAEDAGLQPQSGCRMGICNTCTRRKTRGAVKNLTTGAVSTADDEDVRICVSVPVGDVDIAL